MATEVATPKAIDKTTEALALQTRVREGSLAMQFGQAGLQLRHLEDAIAFAKQMIDGGLCPKGVNRPGAVIWMVQRGAELGLGPTTALDSFYIGPSGKPELYVKAALGICVARGTLDENYEIWTEGEGDGLIAYFKFRRKNWKEPRIRKFSWLEGKQAQLAKKDSNWDKWGQRMCIARVVGFALKDYFSDVFMNCPVEGDEESHPAEVTEISREPLHPAAPDPLLAQLDESEPLPTATWDEVLDQPKVEPDDTQSSPSDEVSSQAGADENRGAPDPAPTPEPPRKPLATKERRDWFWSICRSHGLNDTQITQRLGTAGYETIDQVPADVLEGMIKRVSEAKLKKK